MEWDLTIPPLLVIAVSMASVVYLHTSDLPSPPAVPDRPLLSPNSSHAFATLATPAFAMGAIALGHSLLKWHGPDYDRLCLVTRDVDDRWRRILRQWWTIVEVRAYKPFPLARRSWAKLRLWGIIEYKKVVYLDTDTLVLQPIDDLFNYSQLACVPDPGKVQICNSGVLVIEPRADEFEKMHRFIALKKLYRGIGDQALINSYFGRFTPVPGAYNALRVSSRGFGTLLHSQRLKVIHFVCKKPWKCGRAEVDTCGCGYPSLNKVWYQYFDEACKGHECLEDWNETAGL
jgi:glycogenin glucosyltransferase